MENVQAHSAQKYGALLLDFVGPIQIVVLYTGSGFWCAVLYMELLMITA